MCSGAYYSAVCSSGVKELRREMVKGHPCGWSSAKDEGVHPDVLTLEIVCDAQKEKKQIWNNVNLIFIRQISRKEIKIKQS